MRKLVVFLLVVVTVPALGHAARADRSDEGCQAFNPGQPKCSYVVTHTSTTPVTGIAGGGSWIVKVRRGTKTMTYKSPADGRPTVLEIAFKPKDKVQARALSPGSGLTVGHVDP
jgi:hypothetical protein